MNTVLAHTNGAGLKVLSTETYYGRGGCDICGTSRKEYLVPNLVRFWDCDEGWQTGILCAGCGRDAAERGPREDDYAMRVARDRSLGIDVLAEFMGDDLDGLESLVEDMC